MKKELPKIEDFRSSRGEDLRTLFAVSVLRALDARERQEVLDRFVVSPYQMHPLSG